MEQKQHLSNPPAVGAGRDALDLWAPADPEPTGEPVAVDGPAYSDASDTVVVAVGGHGPGDDAPTAQWPALAPGPVEQNWTEQWAPADTDGLDQLVVAGRATRARTRWLRRAGVVAAFALVLAAIITVAAVLILPGDDAAPPAARSAAGSAPEGWCATGTTGDTTTVATAADPTTPTGAVSTFLSGLIDTRSAATARAAMSPTAPAPTLDDLEKWIGGLPPATNGWCAQITTTESAARVLVELALHTGDKPINVAHRATFYVAATTPTSWAIDAIVSDEGSQP